jgi:hypothetical protein
MRWTPVLALSLVAGAAQAQTFPADGAWTALTRHGVVLVDPALDTSLLTPARDDIGDLGHPAAFVATDGTYLYVRTRVAGDPTGKNGKFLPYGWGCEISTDEDPTNWEVFALLDGHTGMVEVWANTKGRLNSPADPGDTLTASHPIAAGNARAVTTSHGTFVDLAVALADLGVGPTTPLQFVCGANDDGKPDLTGGLDSDIIDELLGDEWDQTASDPFLCSGSSCAGCVTNDHCGLACGACAGTTPICDPDTGSCQACTASDQDADDDLCPPGTTCQANGACVECTTSSQCTNPTKPFCAANGRCQPCAMDGQCPSGDVCDVASGECVVCVTNAQCGGTTPICQSHTCVACSSTGQCPTGTVCDTGSDPSHGACVACVTAADCKVAADPICASNDTCVPCTLDPQCAAKDPNQPACTLAGTCAECTAANDSLCQARNQVCDVDTNRCVACSTNGDCAEANAPICGLDRACHGCTTSSECPQGTVCDEDSGACVGCETSADCKDPGLPICVAHACAPCTTDGECAAKDAGAPACAASGRCVQCTAEASELCTDHAPALVCDLDTDACVQCLVDADCQRPGAPADRPECGPALTCIACTSDAACHDAKEPACQRAGSQQAGSCGQCSATNTTQCSGATPECDVAVGLCVACLTDGDCKDPSRPRCDTSHQCVASCTGNGQCPSERPVCATTGPLAGTCTECEPGQTAHCTESTPVCDGGTDTCVGCVSTMDCPHGVCAPLTHTCVGCESSGDCAAPTPSCDLARNECVSGCTSDESCPPATPVCNLVGPLAGTCTQCSAAEDGACVTPDSKCQLANGTCVACLTNSDCSATPATPHCTDDGQCTGCVTDNDCNDQSPACQPSGVCGQCSASNAAACADGTTCDMPSGRCVALGADGGTMTPPPPPDGGPGAPSGSADGGGGTAPDAGSRGGQPSIVPDKDTVAGGGLSCAIAAHGSSGAPNVGGAMWTALIVCAILFANRRRFH